MTEADACVTLRRHVAQEEALPDDRPLTSHVSLRVPNDVIEAFDRIAGALERPRSWVMLRALRQYLEREGREIEEDTEKPCGARPRRKRSVRRGAEQAQREGRQS